MGVSISCCPGSLSPLSCAPDTTPELIHPLCAPPETTRLDFERDATEEWELDACTFQPQVCPGSERILGNASPGRYPLRPLTPGSRYTRWRCGEGISRAEPPQETHTAALAVHTVHDRLYQHAGELARRREARSHVCERDARSKQVFRARSPGTGQVRQAGTLQLCPA